MASVMWKINALALILGCLGLSSNGQQLHVQHAPSYVVFQSQDTKMSSSDLHNVLAGPLGLNNKQSPAMKSKSVLKRPKANVLITLETHEGQELPLDSMAKFPLDWDTPFVDVEQLMNNLQRKFLDKDPLMLDLVSTNQFFDIKTSSPLFQSLPTSFASARDRLLDPDSVMKHLTPSISTVKSSLNASLSSDGGLLAELQMVDDVVSTLKKNVGKIDTKTPDLLSFTLTGLKGVGKEHGVNSNQAKEAGEIVTKHLKQITDDLKSIYKGNVMVEVLTVPSVERATVRKTRSLMADGDDKPDIDYKHLNLAIDWNQDFPVAFNIVLWLMVILVIAVFFIAYGIWNMNPNLESILYRIPQDESKKLN